MKINIPLITFFCLLFSYAVPAQQSVNYFADAVQKGAHSRIYCVQRSGQYVFIGGSSFDSLSFGYTPSVVKLDTAGNTIWTYTLNKQIDQANVNSGGGVLWNGSIQNMAIDDSFVYVHCNASGTGFQEIWKISQVTGDVIWKKNVADAMVLAVANSSQIAYSYNSGNDYMYELVDKATGKSVFSMAVGPAVSYTSNCFFSIGKDGSVYVVKGDSVTRYSDPLLTTVSWNKKVGSPGGITAVQADGDGLFFFGNGNTFFTGKLNKADGTLAWLSSATYNSNVLQDYVSDFKIYDNYIYVSGEHQFFGSVYSAYHVCALNKATGQVVWESEYNPQWHGPTTDAGNTSGNSLDADAKGNVYVSGYEQSDVGRQGVWGVCKFDPTGKLVYHHSIFDGSPYNSQYSRGMYTFVFDNRVFHLGELQRNPVPYSTPCDVYLTATDTSSIFNPYHSVTTRAGYQEFSNVLDIVNFSSGKYAVLKQVGASIAVELKDSRHGNVLWTQKLKRGWYLGADKMCVTADNKIAVTAISHDATQMLFDYSANPDSLYFFRFDSSGVLSKESKYSILGHQDFRSVQLYPNKDSNTVLLFSEVDKFGNDHSIHLFNFDKATGNVGDYSGYLSSVYAPIPGKQQLLSSLSHDSAIHFKSYMTYNPINQILYEVYTFKEDNVGSGYSNASFALTGLYDIVHNIIPCDSSSVLLSCTSNSSGKNTLIKYNTSQRTVLWTITDPVNSYAIDMGSCSKTKMYLTGRKDNGLVIRQSNISDGSQNWEKILTPAANQYYVPIDQKFNSQRNQYTIAGYIADTTNVTAMQSAFYITVDTTGTIVKQWTQTGDYRQQNSLNAVNITQFGQTIIGGALYKVPYGRSGVLIEADSALSESDQPLSATISVISRDTVCAGDSVMLIASATGCGNCTYSWSTTPAVNSDTLIVKTTGSYTVTVKSGMSASTATKVVTVNTVVQPIISQSNGILTSSSVTGNQWYLNGVPITDSVSQQLKPSYTGIYTVEVGQNSCKSHASAPYVYILSTGTGTDTLGIDSVVLYPNPVKDVLHIRNKQMRAIHIDMFDMHGRKYAEVNGSASDLSINMEGFAKGEYYIMVTDDKIGLQYSMIILKL